ncbi:MAG: Glutamate-semialdehyde aminotransferase [Chloroflexi bacterium]|nr:Glutamate-semialdehyde aminotransferase [Chloroflexota bacterium]
MKELPGNADGLASRWLEFTQGHVLEQAQHSGGQPSAAAPPAGEVPTDRPLPYLPQHLEGTHPLLQLPTDYARPSVQTFRGALQSLVVPRDVHVDLKTLSQHEGTTLFMTLLAAFKILLHRHTAQDDILVGVPATAHTRAELDTFVDVLALRSSLSGNPSFQSLLRRVRETTLGAYTHQAAPFEQLVGLLGPDRDLSSMPLFQVLSDRSFPEDATIELPGLTVETPARASNSKFDLTLNVIEQDEGITCRLIYNAQLFAPERMAEFLKQYLALLEQITATPASPIASYSLVTSSAGQKLPDARAPLPEPHFDPVSTQFVAWAERTPVAHAISQGGRVWTYSDLAHASQSLARLLLGQGLEQGEVVGITGDRSFGLIAAMLGILMSGGVMLTIDETLPLQRRKLMLEIAHAGWLLRIGSSGSDAASPEAHSHLSVIDVDRETGGVVTPVRELCSEPPLPDISPDQAAYLFYTSGTTGVPKGVLGCHKGLSHFLAWQCQTFGIAPGDRIAQLTGLSFDMLLRDVFLPLTSGATLCLPENSISTLVGQHILPWMAREKVTVLHSVPTLAHAWLIDVPSGTSLPALRYVFFAGEPLPDTLVQLWRSRLQGSCEIVNLYGPTETTMVKFWYRVPHNAIPGVQPAGLPMPQTQALVLSKGKQLCGVGEPGEIVIRTPFRTLGYITGAAESKNGFIKNHFRDDDRDLLFYTGDLGRYLPDGMLEVLGRIDDQVKIRGVRIEPAEVEGALNRHSAVRQSVVLARADARGEQSLVAYLVPTPGSAPTVADLHQFLKQSLPTYMVPSAFVMLDAIPRTPNGKADRRALPDPDQAPVETREGYVPPSTRAEEILARIFAEVLGLDRVGIHEDFFALGGHSLRATQVIARIRDAVGIDLPLRRLFEQPTVAGLAPELGAAQAPVRQGPAIPRRAADVPVPLSFAQQRLRFLDQLIPGSALYNVSLAWRLLGPLDPTALSHALEELVRRHESLRTTFLQEVGQVVQQIAAPALVTLQRVDLRELDPDTRLAAALRLVHEDARLPFALEAGPLLRASLFQLSESDHIFLLTLHHIVTDGWSNDILGRELSALYTAEVTGQPSALPALPIQYADYAAWQPNLLAGGTRERLLDYWRARLADAPELLELPTDHPRPPVQSYRGGSYQFQLPRGLTEQLRLLSRHAGTTLFMTLLAGFEVLLYRYSGQTDSCIGTPVAGRSRAELEGVVGFFVNTLVLRADLTGNPSFSALLGQVRDHTLADFDHQDLPFEALVEVLNPPRSQAYHPLFQVMFVLQTSLGAAWALPNVTAEPVHVQAGTAKFDLTLELTETADGLAGVLEYATDLFDESRIERLAGHFTTLLGAIVTDPEQGIDSLPLLSADERQQLLVEWNATATSYPADRCLHQLFEDQAARTPDAVAVAFEDQWLSYRELDQRANQLARYLLTLGLGPEVLVAICLERSLEMVVGLLGILKAGGAYLPLDPQYPSARLAFMLDDAQALLLLTQEHLLGAVPRHGIPVVCLDRDWGAIRQQRADSLESEASAGSLAYVMYTSGSTGTPKGIAVTHRNVVRLVQGADYVPLTPDAVFLQLAPISFDAATFELWGCLLNGARLAVAPPGTLSPCEIGQVIARHQVTTLWLTSGLFNAMVDESLAALKPLRYLLTGGDVVSPAHVRKALRELPGCQIINGYGPTEGTTFTCCYPIPAQLGESGEPLPIGRPIANTQVYILDRYLRPVPIGVPGELYIGGAGVARGYLNRPELTAEKFVADPFSGRPGARLYRSGDLVRYLADGNLEFLGRIDQQVKLRGFRIEPGEIEVLLRREPGVADAVVVLREDRPGDQRLVAYLVPQGVPAGADALRAALQTALPPYMVPSAFVWLDAVPLTPNGKVDRQALPLPGAGERSQAVAYVAPELALHRQLVAIWEELLDARPIGIKDNFFDLGGHSLLAARLMLRIRETCGEQLPLSTLFAGATIERLAAAMEQPDSAEPESLLVQLQAGGTGRPFFFAHGDMEGGGFYTTKLALHLGMERPFYVLQPHSVGGRPIPRTVEAMASDYVAAIRAVQPEGPYTLGGFCNGGLVAYEMAQQLRASEQAVDLVVMIDTTFSRARVKLVRRLLGWYGRLSGCGWDDQLVLYLRLRSYSARVNDFQRLTPAARIRATVRHAWSRTRRLGHSGRDESRQARHGRDTAATAAALREGDVVGVYTWTAAGYTPRRYPGTLALFWASDVAATRQRDPTRGWARLAQVTESTVVPGTHLSAIKEHADVLAKAIQEILDRAQRSSQASTSRLETVHGAEVEAG